MSGDLATSDGLSLAGHAYRENQCGEKQQRSEEERRTRPDASVTGVPPSRAATITVSSPEFVQNTLVELTVREPGPISPEIPITLAFAPCS